MTEEERQRVLDALKETERLSDLYCTGCGYCMPCPNDIDIPRNFQLMNYFRVFGLRDYAQREYKRLEKRRKRDGTVVEAWAAACVECGECEPKCPQDIPIREQLKETHETLMAE